MTVSLSFFLSPAVRSITDEGTKAAIERSVSRIRTALGDSSLTSLVTVFRELARQEARNVSLSPPPSSNAPTSPPLPLPPLSLETVFTVEDVARLLKMTPKAVYARAERGQLPGAFRIGRALRFRGPELVACLIEGRAPSPRRTRR